MRSENPIITPLLVALFLNSLAYPLLAAQIPSRYHTYEEVVSELESLAQAYPEVTQLIDVGTSSLDSLTLWALKVSDNPLFEEDEPAVLYNGVHHAEELLGAEICMYMANDLLSRYGVDPRVTSWVEESEIWIVPIVNPDGHKVVFQGLETWRKNKRDNNLNGMFDPDSDGVDLNRNYDFSWDKGDSSPASAYYRGPSPFSESETEALSSLAVPERFVFNVCYHSARTGLGEVIYYPWRWEGEFSPDHPALREVAESMASLIVNDAGNGTYASIWGDANSGKARNWFYGVMGTLSFTVEVSTQCVPPGAMVDDICERNLVGAYYLLDRIQGSSLTGLVTDSLSGLPLEAEVTVVEAYSPKLPPRMSEPDRGRYRRILVPGTYHVEVSRNGYWPKSAAVVISPGQPAVVDFHLRPIVPQTASVRSAPNPFSGATVIVFDIPGEYGGSNPPATLRIYSLSGQLVYDLREARGFPAAPGLSWWAGRHAVVWMGRDSYGRRVADGTYVCLLRKGDVTEACKMVLVGGE